MAAFPANKQLTCVNIRSEHAQISLHHLGMLKVSAFILPKECPEVQA